jgi:hypothetical protein
MKTVPRGILIFDPMPLLWFQAAKAGCLIRSPADAVAVAFANGEGFKTCDSLLLPDSGREQMNSAKASSGGRRW